MDNYDEIIKNSYDKFQQVYNETNTKSPPSPLFRCIHYANGIKYVGETTKDGIIQGKGFLLLNNEKDLYIGDFQNQKFDGQGIYIKSDAKYRIEGTFKDGKINGTCKKISNNKHIICQFKDGILCGDHILLIHKNGPIYKRFLNNDNDNIAECSSNIASSKENGIMYFKNGDTYEGEFKRGIPNGFGKFYFKNGDIHIGDFVNNKFHGYGERYIKETGYIFKGPFIRGKQDGVFKATNHNGKTFIAQYVKGKFDKLLGISKIQFDLLLKEGKK